VTALWEWLRVQAQADPMGFGGAAGILFGALFAACIVLIDWAWEQR
jgi:hypothetical protein